MAKRTQTDLTGKQIGYLKVIGRDTQTELERKRQGKPSVRIWRCLCQCGKEISMQEKTLLTESSLIRSCGCIRESNPFYSGSVAFTEGKNWNDLYEYVRSTVMDYSSSQCLSNKMVLRLKGLSTGKYMANKKSADKSKYPYDVILATFKYCLPDIQKAMRTKTFHDEMHRLNYACVIVENNLNTVYVRMQNAAKAQEKIDRVDTSILTYNGAEYQPKTGKTLPELESLW